DARLFNRGLCGLLIFRRRNHGELIDDLVFAIRLVSIRVEIPDESAFYDRADRFGSSAALRDLGAVRGLVSPPSPIFGSDESEAAQTSPLEIAHRRSGHLAQLVRGKILCFASADQEQALGFESSRFVQEDSLKDLPCDFAGGD